MPGIVPDGGSLPLSCPIFPNLDAWTALNEPVRKMGLEILEETSILGIILKVVFR
jgi:hypothetical protein